MIYRVMTGRTPENWGRRLLFRHVPVQALNLGYRTSVHRATVGSPLPHKQTCAVKRRNRQTVCTV